MNLFRLKDCNYTNQKFNGSGLLPVALVLACMAISPMAQAVLPAPDGGYGPPAYGQGNTAEGENALLSLTSGTNNTAVGWSSLKTLTTGQYNTAIGAGALSVNTGDLNTATGGAALWSNSSGHSNTANGYAALFSNTEGDNNTAIGDRALFSNRTGGANTAVGRDALYDNTTGGSHTAVGYSALKNTIASGEFTGNTAVGTLALFNDTTGNGNVAVGWGAGLGLTTGSNNTATGSNALLRNTTGYANTADGYLALLNNTTGSRNTALGLSAGASQTGSGNVCIGADVYGVAGESDTTRIRNIYNSMAIHRAVYVNSDYKIGTLASSRRFKEEIKPIDKASEVLLALKPVSFRYKKEFDAGRAPMFGLIAEDVEQVDPGLVSHNEKGEVESVRYDQVNAMLLNEFLKEHRKNEKQEATIACLQKQIEVLTADVQKVSAQLEVTKRPRQLVNNDY